MSPSPNRTAQPGTGALPHDTGMLLARRVSTALLLPCLLAGCIAASEAGPDAADVEARDAAPEASPDVSDVEAHDAASEAEAAQPDGCEMHAQEIDAFVAAHRSCETDADCVIVGDCSHADFKSVARAFEAEAKELVLGNPCGALDGPTYHAVCRAGSCARERSVLSCGNVPQTECPAGTSRYQAGCGNVAATFRDGCHVTCSGEGDEATCAAGFTCQQTTTNPCPARPGAEAACAACGAESQLCLPAPSCQVELSLAFNGWSVMHMEGDESTELQLWLENLTDQTITFSFDVPCHGPRIQGLAQYDLWQECLRGACLMDPVRTELTLAPGEKLRWRSAVLDLDPSDCNAQGLPAGRYSPTFALTNVQGATTCGPAPTLLLTGSEAARR